jgi:hypothetical protein
VAGFPNELILPTLSARLLGRLVVFVNQPGLPIADADWRSYLDWLNAIQQSVSDVGVITAPGGSAPSSAQRSLLNRELRTDHIKVAVLLSDPKLVAIVRVTSWFMKSVEAFKAHELEKALAYLGETDVARVRNTIRELGGTVAKAAT